MKGSQIRTKFIQFYKQKNHQEISPAPLVPENDPTTLFTSSGMQPLVPFLLGEKHPQGKRLVNSQRSFRSQDVEEVGDNRHTTFFEMLGNWSLGDYFKKEQLAWFFHFLTGELKLDPHKLYVTAFAGNSEIPKDTQSIAIWKELFSQKGIEAIEGERIFTYPVEKNWWSRSGTPDKMPPGEPGGPDSEVFYDFGTKHNPSFGKKCHPNCDCGRFFEIGNSVFMQYQKKADGFIELPHKNVDFGGGLERLTATSQNYSDIFKTDLFLPLISVLEQISHKLYQDEKTRRPMQIISDHLKAAVFMIADGVIPSNKAQGYVLRRLIRRSLVYARELEINQRNTFLVKLIDPVIEIYKDFYPYLIHKKDEINTVINEEYTRFSRSLEKGIREINNTNILDGKVAFKLYETYGFPWEMTREIAQQRGQKVDKEVFAEEFRKHQNLSRTTSSGMFKGGLADHSEETTKLHTATHLLHTALRKVLGNLVVQKGSHITSARLRFDFTQSKKMSPKQLKEVEELVNEQIKKNLPVSFLVMSYKQAVAQGALAFFADKYEEKVKVYTIGNPEKEWFSKEVCGGPHVDFTSKLGHFRIIKEESVSSGVRRIYAVLNKN